MGSLYEMFVLRGSNVIASCPRVRSIWIEADKWKLRDFFHFLVRSFVPTLGGGEGEKAVKKKKEEEREKAVKKKKEEEEGEKAVKKKKKKERRQ